MRIRGIIFDFNGVLVDDEHLHFQAFRAALQQEGFDLTWEDYCENYLPYDDETFFEHFLQDQGREPEKARLRQLIGFKSRQYFTLLGEKPPVIQSSIEFVQGLPAELLLAIASAAARHEIELILGILELRERFHAIVAAGEVKRGKPHPDAFLKALRLLQQRQPDLEARQVIGVEDSERGLRAIRAAGMKSVGLVSTYAPERLQEASLVVENLSTWSLKQLEAALQDG